MGGALAIVAIRSAIATLRMLAERGISVDHDLILAGSSATPGDGESGCAGSGGVALIEAAG